jgi:hypothetical protein
MKMHIHADNSTPVAHSKLRTIFQYIRQRQTALICIVCFTKVRLRFSQPLSNMVWFQDEDCTELAIAWQPRSCLFILLRTLNAFPHPACEHLNGFSPV